jgi:hypothetical protein
MTTYTAISNTLVAVGAKPFASTIQALRDNPIAIAEGAPGAPVNQAAWHPFNMTAVGDGATGVIWSFPVDGAVLTITSPDFIDGYEYAFRFDQVRCSTSAGASFIVDFFREIGSAYSGGQNILSISLTNSFSGSAEFIEARTLKRFHHANVLATLDGGNTTGVGFSLFQASVQRTNVANPDTLLQVRHGVPEKILRVRFFLGSPGNITGSGTTGQIYMFKRRVFK